MRRRTELDEHVTSSSFCLVGAEEFQTVLLEGLPISDSKKKPAKSSQIRTNPDISTSIFTGRDESA